SFPGLQPTGSTAVTLGFFDGRFNSRNIPSPANRYGGQNWGGYADPDVDRLIGQLAVTLDQREAWNIEGDLLAIVSRAVAYFPYYSNPSYTVAATGFSGVLPVNAQGQSGQCEITWNVADWDLAA